MRASTSRRTFFRLSVDELIASIDKAQGCGSFRLSDLPALDNRDIAKLIPAIADASGITVEDDRFVVARHGSPPRVLFPVGSREEEIWARMNGRSTIGEIAIALADQWGEPHDAAFAAVRGLFLTLVAREICLPCNPLP